MQDHPLVSVIVPVHNGERFLADAIASIHQQHYPVLEIIVVDDGSTDGTADLIDRLGNAVRGTRQPRHGLAAARNHGLDLAHGELIAFHDADEVWPHDTLRTLVEHLLHEPSLDAVLGRVQPIRASDARRQDMPVPLVARRLGSAVFRRGVFERVGALDEQLCFSEDQDWFLRAREQGMRLAVLNRVTLQYRLDDSTMTGSPDHRGSHLPAILKASLDRRRAQGAGWAQPLPALSEIADARAAPTGETDEPPWIRGSAASCSSSNQSGSSSRRERTSWHNAIERLRSWW